MSRETASAEDKITAMSSQGRRTFFVTSVTHERRPIFASERLASLFLEVVQRNRELNHFLLHEIVLMPDHFHLLITPAPNISLEKVMQLIKGGYSFRQKKEMRSKLAVWQRGFKEHRIKDSGDYAVHRSYIRNNPVRTGLAASPDKYPYCSAHTAIKIDAAPPGLKPKS